MQRRKKEGGLAVLLASPWWVSAIAGLVAYGVLRWIVPPFFAPHPMLAGLSMLSQSVAWLALPAFGIVALMSFFMAKRSDSRTVELSVRKSSAAEQSVPRPAPVAKAEWDGYRDQQTVHSTIVPPDTPEWSIESLRSLEWKRFELLCARYYEAVGFKAATLAGGADGGIDIKLYKGNDDKPIAIVQCKVRNTQLMGVKEVRELLGVMAHEEVARGIFITSGAYSKEALAFGDSNPIHLLDGTQFLQRIQQLDAPRQKALAKFAFEGDYRTPTCASCGIKLVKRTGSKGEFWGCTNFPRCHTTMKIRHAETATQDVPV